MRSDRNLARAAAALSLTLGVAALAGACSGTSSEKENSLDGVHAGAAAAQVNKPFQPDGTPVRGGHLTFARSAQPTSFTPWIGVSNAELMVQVQVYDQLVEVTPDPAKLEPALADSWVISDDNLSYTFHLRSGVKFSNGQPLSPEDVKYSIDTQRDPKLSPNRSVLLESIKTVSVVDDSHVRLDLKRVTPAILNYLSLTHIVCKSEVQRLGDKEFGLHPVGTGPFVVTKFSPGDPTIELVRNPYYWRKGLPYLDRLTYKYIPDDNARMLAVESGDVDIAEGVPFSQVDRVKAAAKTSVFAQNAFASDWIIINGFDPDLSKKAVRQALVYATPLEQISKVVFHGLAPAAATANMPTKYMDESIKPYPYDIDKAKKLLASANEANLSVTLSIVSGDAIGKQVATILQESWAKAGVKLNVQERDLSSLSNAAASQNFDLIMFRPVDQTSDIALDDEFDSFMVAKPAKGNFPFSGWDNPQARQLVEQATSTMDEGVRKRNFSEYQRILHDEQPIISLVHVPNLFAVRDNVHGFVAVGTFWPLLYGTWTSS
ncbi:peptide/nickel transport system substrate-binding protein [Marmoricola sp. URHA0025 HA25]